MKNELGKHREELTIPGILETALNAAWGATPNGGGLESLVGAMPQCLQEVIGADGGLPQYSFCSLYNIAKRLRTHTISLVQ